MPVHHLIALALACLAPVTSAWAQATLADPYPQMGNQAEAAAANAGMAAHSGQGSKLSPAEQARRRAHKAQLSACNARVREQLAPGSRQAARAQCRASFAAQRATWVSAGSAR